MQYLIEKKQNEEGKNLILLTFLLKLLLLLVLLFLIIAAVLLLVPFYYHIDLAYNKGMALDLKVRWAKRFCLNGIYNNDTGFVTKFSIFGKEIILKPKNKTKQERKQKGKAGERKKHKKRKFKINDIMDKYFLEELMAFLKKILVVIKPEQLKIKLVYGFDDPFITGSVSGVVYFLESIFPDADYDISPVFDEVTADFEMVAGGKLTLGTFMVELIRFLFKKDVRNKLKNLIKAETFS